MNKFQHQHTAHCETGVMSSMLDYHGVQISEPMALGLSSSIAFAYLPFIKLNGLPLIAYRMPPRSVIKGLKKRLKLNLDYERFTDPKKGMIALDKQLDAGNIVGLQTSVYWLPYFPDDMRFHFNAHNLLVYAKKNNTYLISDPVFEKPVSCSTDELQKARFSRGALAPKGMMYFIDKPPKPVNYTKLIPLSIKSSARSLTAPIPIIGIRGIRFLANKLARLDRTMPDKKQQILFLGHIIRMQEEIGTGGAGFRYMYASFLQESATLMNNKLLEDASNMMTDVGDHWRNFALHTVKMCKNRSHYDLRELSKLLHKCASEELKVWKLLKKI
ncbi:MAG: BtrH N-terminal domain-containing protein [Xanthomonadales bacterium]|nr:BtrH N-terminal domain-containing protein [Xanthomonadales bacterium]